jgi:hypothetical protein
LNGLLEPDPQRCQVRPRAVPPINAARLSPGIVIADDATVYGYQPAEESIRTLL